MSNYDYCGDVDGPARPPVPRTNEERQLQTVQADRARQLEILHLTLLAQNGPVTEVTSPVTGDDVSDEWAPLYRNVTDRAVRVQVFADFVTPGCGAVLGLTTEKGNQGKVDELSLTANGRTESVSIILMPNSSLYMREFRTAFPMAGQDVLRVRIFDPMKLLSYGKLYNSPVR